MRGKSWSLIPAVVLVVSCSPQGPADDWDVEAGAELRWQVKQVLAALEPECPLTEDAALLDRYEPLRDRYQTIKQSAGGTSAAKDIMIAEIDEEFRRSTYVLECGPVDRPGGFHETMESYMDERFAELSEDIDEMADLVDGAGEH